MAQAVAAYKGQGRRQLAGFFGEKLLAAYRERYAGLPLVPVPCRAASLKKRGFDQIGLLCRELELRGGVKVLRLLQRGKKTREQKTLNREERARNLAGSIQPLRRLPSPLPEEAVLLDDVFTTGATANECAGALSRLGIGKTHVLTIALD